MSFTVSVVIPTYNRPDSTARAIRSALGQTYPVHEIIVVDDASAPAFDPLAAGCSHDLVRAIRLDRNVGASAARQTGVDAATGDVIAFLDSDDLWLPEKTAAQIALLEQAGGGLVAVACGWETVPEHGQKSARRIPIASADVADFASGCWYSPGTTILMPRSVFDVVGPFDPDLRRLEDFDWFLRFALAGGRIAVPPIVGAVVSTGRRGRFGPVADASAKIITRFADGGMLPDSSTKRCLRAYLELEQAASARNDRRPLAMAWHLGRSLTLAPRATIPLRRWWRA